MVNEIGIRKYIRMLLEQRPEKVGFGNAPNQNQFSVATKPVGSRLSNYIAYGDFQYSLDIKSNNDRVRNVMTKTILDQQKNIQASGGKYKYFQNHAFTKDEIKDLFLDNTKQQWLGKLSKAITGREYLNRVYRYYRFFDLIDVDDDGIPADIDDVSLSLANYFTINEEEIKSNIKKNVYGKYVKSENTELLANFTNYRLPTDEKTEAFIEKSQRYMKTILRPYIDVFEKSMIDFLYEELYFGAINATKNEMQYNTTILLPYPNLYYSLDYMKKSGFIESSVSYDTYKTFYATLYDQIENMKDVFDPKTNKTSNELAQIFSDPEKYNIIIYSLDLKWSPNLMHEETEESQHPDITQVDLQKNPTAFYDWEISKSHAERISPKSLHLSDLNSFLLAVKNTDAGTAITKSLDRSLTRIEKQSKFIKNKIKNAPLDTDFKASAAAAREELGAIQTDDIEEALEEVVDLYKDRTGVDITKFLTYDAREDRYVHVLERTSEMKKYDADLLQTLIKFNKLSKDLLETYTICLRNARRLKEKQSYLDGGDIRLDYGENSVKILDGYTENKLIPRHNISQLVDPTNKIIRNDTFLGYFPIILQLGYNRPEKLTSTEEVSLQFETVKFKTTIIRQKQFTHYKEKRVRVAAELPTFHTTRTQMKNAEKLHTINRPLLRQIDEMPDFDIVTHSKIHSGLADHLTDHKKDSMSAESFVRKLEDYEKKLENIYSKYVKVAGKLYLASRKFTGPVDAHNNMGAVIRLYDLYKDYNEKNITGEIFINRFKYYDGVATLKHVLDSLSFKDYPSFNEHFKIVTDNDTLKSLNKNIGRGVLIGAVEREAKRKEFKGEMAGYQADKHEKFKADLQKRIEQRQKKFDSIADFTKYSQETLDLMANMYRGLYKHKYEKYFTDSRFTTDEVKKNLAKLKTGSDSDFDYMPFHMLQGVLKTYQQMLQYEAFEAEYAKSGEVMTKGQKAELDLIGALDDTDKYLAAMKQAAIDDDSELFAQGKHGLQKELQRVINKIDDPAKSIEASGQINTLKAAQRGLELVELTNQMFDEIEAVMELKEDLHSPGEKSPKKRAKNFLKYMQGTIDNHDNVDDDWRGEEIDYFEDLNVVFDNVISPDKIYIGVTKHPGNSTYLMDTLKDRFGRAFETSKSIDYDYNGSMAWNDYHLRDEDIIYVHISIKPDAFTSAKDFSKALDVAEVLFHLCDELDKPTYEANPASKVINDLFGIGKAYAMHDIKKYFVSALSATQHLDRPIHFFSSVMSNSWILTSPFKKDIELNFVLLKK